MSELSIETSFRAKDGNRVLVKLEGFKGSPAEALRQINYIKEELGFQVKNKETK